MKNFTLVVSMLCFWLAAPAQTTKPGQQPPPNTGRWAADGAIRQETSKFKGGGEAFWTEEFNWASTTGELGWLLPAGWVIEDPSDLGYNWHWAIDTLKGVYTNEPPINSTSKANGFLALNADGYNQDLGHYDNYLAVNSSLVSPPINCTGHPSVLVRIEQNFRYWSNSVMLFEVTNDNGVHWASFDMKMGTKVSERVGGIKAGEKVDLYLNLTDVAANMPNVQFKITWRDAKLYYWMIDDITFLEGFDDDLQLVYSEADYDNGTEDAEGFFYGLPKTQLSGFDFTGIIKNFGNIEQWGTKFNVQVTKNNQIIYNESTPSYTLYPGITDTFKIPTQFIPTDFGHYKVDFEAKAELPDMVPGDNKASALFMVTDSMFSRCDDVPEVTFSTWEWYTVPHEGDLMGTWYRIKNPIEVSSISVYISSADIQSSFRLVLLGYNEETQSPVELLGSELISMDSTILKNHWVTLPLQKDGEGEFLEAGKSYMAAIEFWNNMDFEAAYASKRYALGSDRSNYFPANTCWYFFTNDDEWYSTDEDLFMIRLNLNDHSNLIDGISDPQNGGVQLNQNFPNPFTEETTIGFTLANPSEVNLIIKDISGRTVSVRNFGNKPSGENRIVIKGNELEPGNYFYTLQTRDFNKTLKMTVVR